MSDLATSVAAAELRAAIAEDGERRTRVEVDQLSTQARLISEGDNTVLD